MTDNKVEEKNTLLATPFVAMTEILKSCNYIDSQSLRKTCHGIRELVDLVKPDPQLKSVLYAVNRGAIIVTLGFLDGKSKGIYYFDDRRGGCLISTREREAAVPGHRIIANTTMASVVLQDFNTLKESLLSQPPLEQVMLVMGEDALPVFHACIAPSLADQPSLYTESLQMVLGDCRHATSVLPLVSADVLDTLMIMSIGERRDDVVLDLAELAVSEHWRSVQTLVLHGPLIDDPMPAVSIPNSFIQMVTIRPEQVSRLKEELRISTTLQLCLIQLQNDENRVQVLRAIVPEGIDNDVAEGTWNFRTPQPGKLLRVAYFPNHLSFSFAIPEKLEADAVVLD